MTIVDVMFNGKAVMPGKAINTTNKFDALNEEDAKADGEFTSREANASDKQPPRVKKKGAEGGGNQ